MLPPGGNSMLVIPTELDTRCIIIIMFVFAYFCIFNFFLEIY